jgi:RNA polymerase sigma-70 factor (ECF subfamily)
MDVVEPDQAAVTDARALAWLRTRDPDGIRTLVSAWSGGMLRVARLQVASTAAAEDIVQDAWLVMLEAASRYEGRGSLRGYAHGIVFNLARRAAGRERRTLPFSSAWREARAEAHGPAVPSDRFDREGRWLLPPRAWQQSVEDELDAHELQHRIEAAIDALPPRQRAVMTAADVLGFEGHEVCELFDLTPSNERVLLHRARAKVRATLEPPPEGSVEPEARSGSRKVSSRPRRGDPVVCQQLVELVDDYLDGSLDADLRDRVEAHLVDCGHCGEYVSQVRNVLHVTACLAINAPSSLLLRLTTALATSKRP